MSGANGDEIAVVGLAGRFPGASDVAALWQNLLDGVDAVHDHTDAELRALGVGERLLADPAHVRAAGRLDGVADFDAGFFGIPAADAALMDPQHRLFLEQAYVALADAGWSAGSSPGSSSGSSSVSASVSSFESEDVVGVFAGSSTSRYFLFHLFGNPAVTGDDPDDRERRLVAGAAPDYLPAQVAYRLGATGPAIAVQTACSSSLVAVCSAAQSLLDYRCDLALAGGVSVTEPRFRSTPTGLVSPDGRCRAFDAAGQGSGYGSGVAVLALRRLADAVEAGDSIYAVLRGWAVNNDGSSRAGFAAPGLDGQAAVVAEALASADVTADTIGYVEAHGSGTLLGDAIEVAALRRAFERDAAAGAAPCLLGSVKTNLGNLDAAAGAAGLIKAVFAVRDGVIPASLHFDTPNPQIDFGRFTVATKTTEWPDQPGQPARRACVSSFGLGGTNAHVVVEQPSPPGPRGRAPSAVLLPVSGHTPQAMRDAVNGLRSYLAARGGDEWLLADVAYTLAGRRAFGHRVAVVAHDVPGALAALENGLKAPFSPASGLKAPFSPFNVDNLHRLAAAWAGGADVDWASVYAGGEHRRVWLPPYPFQRTRHWIEAP